MNLRSIQNIISLRDKKFFVLGFLFCSVVTFNALAQEERSHLHSDTSDGLEKITDLERPVTSESENDKSEIKENKVLSAKKEKEQLYKHRGEKEIKNESKSTLSFNLFLYVVDQFKEDN